MAAKFRNINTGEVVVVDLINGRCDEIAAEYERYLYSDEYQLVW